jgi:hypothetical protein
LSFSARWVYSFLVFRTSLNKPASEDCICRNLGTCNRAIKHYLQELQGAALLAEVDKHYLANEPGEHREWFVQKSNAKNLPWFQQFASYAVYVPNAHQGLPLTHSALLSLVWSLKHGSGWLKIRTAGLVTMLFPDLSRPSAKRQVNRAAKNLRDKGLLDDQWNVTIQQEHHRYWRDADQLVNPRSRSDVGYVSLREYVTGSLGNYQCQYFFENLCHMGRHLDLCEQAMKQAGYNEAQILQYWEEVMCDPAFCNRKCRYVEVFAARGFMEVFKLAERMTSENRIAKGYIGISLGFLRKLSQYEMLAIKDLDTKTDSTGASGSLLLCYEPRLQGSFGTAA